MASPSIGDLLSAAQAAPPEHRDVSVVLDRAVAEQVDALNARIVQLETEHDEKAEGFEAEREEVLRDQRFSDPRPAEIDARATETLEALQEQIRNLAEERDALVEGTLVTLRFTKLPGQAWSGITSHHPMRVNVTIDRLAQYNYHEAAKEAAAYVDPDTGTRYGVRVTRDDDGNEALETLEAEQWATLLELLSGGEFERIAQALFDMNDWGPRQRAQSRKKA